MSRSPVEPCQEAVEAFMGGLDSSLCDTRYRPVRLLDAEEARKDVTQALRDALPHIERQVAERIAERVAGADFLNVTTGYKVIDTPAAFAEFILREFGGNHG